MSHSLRKQLNINNGEDIMPNAFISTAKITMPANVQSRGGNKAVYPFEKLAVGQSIAVLDKTKKQLTTTLSSNNRKEWPVLDAAGKPIMKAVTTREPEMKDGAPVMVKGEPKMIDKPVLDDKGAPKMEPKMEKRVFFIQETDPETDPEKATCRIWREK